MIIFHILLGIGMLLCLALVVITFIKYKGLYKNYNKIIGIENFCIMVLFSIIVVVGTFMSVIAITI